VCCLRRGGTRAQYAGIRRSAAFDSSALMPDLERFWPSRRGHAFDEFCR
jgi:hypothetical protein